MSNLFGNIGAEGLEQAKDTLGGGFGAIDSDVYNGTIKAAYAGESSGGARSLTFVVGIEVNGQPRDYREVVYVTSGKAKGQKPYYEKDGKKSPLPGFTTANDICLMSTGKALELQPFEEKVIKLYDYDAKAEVPTKVQMAVDLIGRPITLAILRERHVKQVKVGNDYVDADDGSTVDKNTIDKAFHTDTGLSVSEHARGLDKGEFIDLWRDKNKGQVKDRTEGKAGKTGAPGQAAAAGGAPAPKGKSLFG